MEDVIKPTEHVNWALQRLPENLHAYKQEPNIKLYGPYLT